MPLDPMDEFVSKKKKSLDPMDDFVANLPKNNPIEEPVDEFKDTPHGFRVKPAVVDGKQTVIREDDKAAYFGPQQGNTGKAGWFDGSGNRVGDKPGASAPYTAQQFGQLVKDDVTLAYKGLTQVPSIKMEQGENWLMDRLGLQSPQRTKAYSADIQRRLDEITKIRNRVPLGGLIQDAPLMVMMPNAAAAEIAPAGMIGLTKGMQLAGRVKQGATIGGTYAATQPVEEGKEFIPQLVSQVGMGAGLGGVVPVGAEGVSRSGKWLSGKVANKLAGTKLGERLGIKTEIKPQYQGTPGNPGAIERSQELDSVGITKHTVGDVTGERSIRKMEDAIGRNNPKMDEFRQGTIDQTSAYADEVLNRLETAMKREKWSSIADVEAAAQAGGKRSGEANALLTAIKNSGDDWREIAKTDGGMELLGRKLRADAKYDKAEAIAKLYGPVKPDGLVGSLKANISRLERNPAEDQTLLPYFKKVLEGIEDGTQATGFGDLRRMRTALNGKAQGLSSPGAMVQDVNASRTALGNVTKALEADLDKYASSHSSGLRNAWKDATDYYRTAVVPFKEAGIAKALADKDPIKLVTLLNGKNDMMQARTLELMGEKGRAAVRAGIIDQALTAGGKTQRGTMGLDFSPMGAAAELERSMKNGIGKLAFNGKSDAWTAEGMTRILRTVDRISNLSGASTTTGLSGQEIGKVVKGDATILGTAERIYAWLNRDALMKLYTDPKGRALLQRASSMKPGSPSMVNLVEKDIPKFLGMEAPKNVIPFRPAVPAGELPTVAQNQENQ